MHYCDANCAKQANYIEQHGSSDRLHAKLGAKLINSLKD